MNCDYVEILCVSADDSVTCAIQIPENVYDDLPLVKNALEDVDSNIHSFLFTTPLTSMQLTKTSEFFKKMCEKEKAAKENNGKNEKKENDQEKEDNRESEKDKEENENDEEKEDNQEIEKNKEENENDEEKEDNQKSEKDKEKEDSSCLVCAIRFLNFFGSDILLQSTLTKFRDLCAAGTLTTIELEDIISLHRIITKLFGNDRSIAYFRPIVQAMHLFVPGWVEDIKDTISSGTVDQDDLLIYADLCTIFSIYILDNKKTSCLFNLSDVSHVKHYAFPGKVEYQHNFDISNGTTVFKTPVEAYLSFQNMLGFAVEKILPIFAKANDNNMAVVAAGGAVQSAILREETDFTDIDFFILDNLKGSHGSYAARHIIDEIVFDMLEVICVDRFFIVRRFNTMTIYREKMKPIQIIVSQYRTVAELLSNFDIDICACAFTPEFLCVPRAVTSLATRTIHHAPSSDVVRLEKYFHRGFSLAHFPNSVLRKTLNDWFQLDPSFDGTEDFYSILLKCPLILEQKVNKDISSLIDYEMATEGKILLSKIFPISIKNIFCEKIPDFSMYTVEYGYFQKKPFLPFIPSAATALLTLKNFKFDYFRPQTSPLRYENVAIEPNVDFLNNDEVCFFGTSVEGNKFEGNWNTVFPFYIHVDEETLEIINGMINQVTNKYTKRTSIGPTIMEPINLVKYRTLYAHTHDINNGDLKIIDMKTLKERKIDRCSYRNTDEPKNTAYSLCEPGREVYVVCNIGIHEIKKPSNLKYCRFRLKKVYLL